MRYTWFWAFLLIHSYCFGQFYDDFTGNLDDWSGDVESFTLREGRLYLEASMAGEVSIWQQVRQMDTMRWSGQVQLDFQPSASNRLDLILWADSSEIRNGLIARLGESGSTDSLRLILIKDGSSSFAGAVSLPSFASDSLSFSYNLIKVGTRFELSISDNDSSGSRLILDLDDPQLPIISGVKCKFTTTRSDRFSFGHLACGGLFRDTIPPFLLRADAIGDRHIQLFFSEIMDTGIKPDVSIVPLIEVDSIHFDPQGHVCTIELESALESGRSYQLSVEKATDVAGNPMVSQTLNVVYYSVAVAREYGLLISELMADPEPNFALPPCEYIELYNNSEYFVNLSDYTLTDPGKQVFLPDTILAPGAFVALVEDGCAGEFPSSSRMLAVDDLPSLNNDADVISLVDFAGRIIHEVSYDRSWYRDDDRAFGGWSLEMMSTDAICLGKNNWRSADREAYGSPGRENTNADLLTWKDTLRLIKAEAMDSMTIELEFDRWLQADQNISVDVDPYPVVHGVAIQENKVILATQPLKPGIGYAVSIVKLEDCIETLHHGPFIDTIFRPTHPDSAEVVINEILFDPISPSSEYIELFNVTDRYFSIDKLCIESLSESDTTTSCLDEPVVIEPGEYFVLARDTAQFRNDWSEVDAVANLEFGPLDDERGKVDLFYFSGGEKQILDMARYRSGWHSAILIDNEGYALERLSSTVSGLNAQNWYSAHSLTRGTPGQPNSHRIYKGSDDRLSIHDDIFSPDGDGHEDFCQISIRADQPGYNLRMDVCDLKGRFVTRLANNEIVNGQNHFIWDGRSDEGLLQPVGLYLVIVEMTHPSGDQWRERRSVVRN